MSLPILYSLRQCPYAMRARLGILLAEQSVLLRDIVMTNIPEEMIAASVKAEVPVLVFENSTVIDESLDIMLWAFNQSDPNNLLYSNQPNIYTEMLSLIKMIDIKFVDSLKQYKAASRYHDDKISIYRLQCEKIIKQLEQRFSENEYLFGKTLSLADYAILPFIRQFSRVERKWFVQAPYPNLHRWLKRHYQNPIFSKAMTQYPQWLNTKDEIIFGKS